MNRRVFLILALMTGLQTRLSKAGDVPAAAPSKDVLFLIDGSGSVKPANFDKLRVFLKQLVDDFDSSTKVACIQFSSRKLTKVEFNLDTFNNKVDIQNAIDNMKYQRRYTYTGYGMKLAREQVFNGRGGDRPYAKNVLLVFTDGEAADPHIARAQSSGLKSSGSHVISIGFGPKKSVDKFKNQLQAMASSSERDVFTNGIKDLEDIQLRLRQAVAPKYDCSTNPCKNGGTCRNVEDTFECTCLEDYEGFDCGKKKGICKQKPCLNGGVCYEGTSYLNGFTCVCHETYYGDLCEKKKEVCKAENADILFILDGSLSIKSDDFDKMKTFVIEFVNRFNISKNETRVSLIQFSSTRLVKVEIFLYHYNNKRSLIKKIETITLQYGDTTHTDVALSLAREQVFQPINGDRENVRNVIVLLTDGEAHRPEKAIEEAAKLKNDGDVSILAIGVGRGEVDKTFQEFLTKIASKPKYVFKASFSELDTIQNEVIKAACENLRNL